MTCQLHLGLQIIPGVVALLSGPVLGSTIQPLSYRLSHHLCSFKMYKDGKSRYCSSYEIFKLGNISIILLDKINWSLVPSWNAKPNSYFYMPLFDKHDIFKFQNE